ncbi:hypothetical protein AMS68_006368 [Peltaster fructicola]|uniref:Uncharacterized protein n=1 Tax=Peltaster fructicola TaxID=286661 RepID=A0A6H0Y1R1_9PEZI|nr:hypothetical protein AMS68_006368 [Peltaster fructicola]
MALCRALTELLIPQNIWVTVLLSHTYTMDKESFDKLSDREVHLFAAAWLSLETPPKPDYEKVAKMCGYKTAASAGVVFGNVKRKFAAENASEAEGTPAKKARTTAKATPKKRADKTKKSIKEEHDDGAEKETFSPKLDIKEEGWSALFGSSPP